MMAQGCCQVYRGNKKMRKIALLSCLVLASAAFASAAAAKHYHHRAHWAQARAESLTTVGTPVRRDSPSPPSRIIPSASRRAAKLRTEML
jgi:hypothetical protein